MECLLSSFTAVQGLDDEHLEHINNAQLGTIEGWALQDQAAR